MIIFHPHARFLSWRDRGRERAFEEVVAEENVAGVFRPRGVKLWPRETGEVGVIV